MAKTKVKPTETIGDDLPILTFQVSRIMKNCQYQVDIKNEWVQWVTADVNRTSLKSITQAQAKKIIMAQEGSTYVNQHQPNWGFFDKNNSQHLAILSLMRQAHWTKDFKANQVPDIDRLSSFLQSDKSPVNKPLTKMNNEELSKVIFAFEGIVKSKYK